jgi:LysR family transcriptional regulator of gallate degradation
VNTTEEIIESALPFSLKALRAAVAVAGHGGAARAASAINMSATAITRSIQSLETALGMPLFERHTRGMAPTAAGRIIVERASRAFDQLECAGRELRGADAFNTAAGDTNSPSRFARLANERLLLVLVSIAETGSATRTADRLQLSQPAVSQAIRELEHCAGARLVERSARGLRLTESAEILLRRIKLALMELRVAVEEAASLQGVLHGRVTVAALPYSSVDLVPQAATRCLQRHPRITVTVIDGTYDSLIEQLRSAEIDMIVGTLRPVAYDDVEQEALVEDTLSVVCRVGHPYARAGRLELRDVVGAQWVVPLPRTVTRASFEAAFRSEQLDLPSARLEVHNPMAIRSILLSSDHLALLSARQIRSDIAAGLLTVLPIGLRDTGRTMGLTVRRDSSHSPGVVALRDELRAAATQLAGSDPPAEGVRAAQTGTSPAIR